MMPGQWQLVEPGPKPDAERPSFLKFLDLAPLNLQVSFLSLRALVYLKSPLLSSRPVLSLR